MAFNALNRASPTALDPRMRQPQDMSTAIVTPVVGEGQPNAPTRTAKPTKLERGAGVELKPRKQQAAREADGDRPTTGDGVVDPRRTR